MNGTMILDLKQTRVMEVPIERITRSAIMLRPLDEQVISDIMMSIKSCGLLQPIMLTPRGEQFEVIFGNHRLEACKRLCWKEISAVIGKVSSEEAFILQVVENIQRNNVINPVEEAKGYKLLIEKGWTYNEISGKIGKSYQYVWSRIKLIQNLHPLILEGLANRKFRKLSLSHAEQLSLIKNPRRQLELANVIEDYNISLEELEAVVYTDMFPPAQNEEQKRQLPRLRKSGSSFFIEKDRICLLTEETVNIVLNHLGRKARAIGRKAGKSRRKRILFKPDRTIPKENLLLRN